MLKIVALIILSLISGILYRLGGIGHPFNRYYRRVGCTLTSLLSLFFLFGFTLPVFLCTPLIYFSLTTYCKFGKQKDVIWYNWVLTGFIMGLSLLPILLTGHFIPFMVRTLVLMVTVTLISEMSDNVWVEEIGRGFLNSITLLFFM